MFDDTFVNFTEGIQNDQIIDCFFINIIPQKNSLEIIIGYNNEHTNDCLDKFTQSWKNLSTNQLLNKIVDLFNYSIESWGMSPSFYKRLLEKKLIERV